MKSLLLFPALFILLQGCNPGPQPTPDRRSQFQHLKDSVELADIRWVLDSIRNEFAYLRYSHDSLCRRYNLDLASTYNDMDTLFVRSAKNKDNVPLELGKWTRRGKRTRAFLGL